MSSGKPTTARAYLDSRIMSMRSERSSWIPHWRELMRNFSPRRGKFTETDRNKGQQRNNLSNNTPLFARRVLTSGLMTGMTNPSRPWFRLHHPDPELSSFGPVRAWLDEVEKLMYRVFSSSNLYKVLPTMYEEAGVIGTAAMIQEEDFENIIRFTPFTAGEYMLDIDSTLRVDSFAREYQLTVHQVFDKFAKGKDLSNISISTRNNYDNSNYNAWVSIRHVIEPVKLGDYPELKLDKSFKWRSVCYESGRSGVANKFLSVKGYHDFPILPPRWDSKAGDIYGFSPGMDALGDARALQVQEREKGKAIAKMVAPPTVAPNALKGQNLSLLPGANNFSNDVNNVFRPIYQVNPRVNELSQDIKNTEDRINRAFYVDMFLMIANMQGIQPRNVSEIAVRQEEKLLQLGTVLESLHDDLLDPLIDNTFSRLIRLSQPGWQGTGDMLLPVPPQALEGKQLKVEYISVLDQAQRMVSTESVERWISFTGNLAALKPDALDKINEDKAIDNMAVDLGIPTNIVNNEEQVKKTRKVRAKQQQAAEQQARTAAMIDSAKTLGDTPTGGGNVLNDIVGVGAAPGGSSGINSAPAAGGMGQ